MSEDRAEAPPSPVIFASYYSYWPFEFHLPHVMHGPTHVNAGYEINWVERGRLEFECGPRIVAGGDGASILIPPGIENTPRARSARVRQLVLPPPLVEDAKDALGHQARLPDEGITLGPDSRPTRIVRLVVRELEEGASSEDPVLRALVDALAYALVRTPFAAPPAERLSRRIRRVLAAMEAQYGSSLSVDDLAGVANMTRYGFMRAFRREVGRSVYQHLTLVRLEQAARQLRASNVSVLEVALSSGFGDAGRFARAFRLRFGVTPRMYRSMHDSTKR